MSRFTTTVKDDPSTTVAYGLDHATGWFYQEFDANDKLVVDLDTMMTGLSKGHFLNPLG